MRQSSVTIVSDDPDEPEIEISMIAEVLSVGDETGYPDRYSLSTPYPNPFNSTVSVSYSVPLATDVSVKVYNISGQFVASLVNEKHAQGRHTISWTADNFASGMYFVKMEAANFRDFRKIILTR